MDTIKANIEKYELEILKKLHLLLFKKNAAPQFIRRNIRKFEGLEIGEQSNNAEFIKKNFSDDDIIDLCGILGEPATLNTTDNIVRLVQKLTPEIDDVEVTSNNSEISFHSTEDEMTEMRVLIKKQSAEMFEIQRDMLAAKKEQYRNPSQDNLKKIEFFEEELSILHSRKIQLDEEFKMLLESQRFNSSRIQENNFNEQPPTQSQPTISHSSPEMNLFRAEMKSILLKSSDKLRLPDFEGCSSID